MPKALAARVQRRRRGRAPLRRAHRVLVVLDDEDHRQRPQRRHVEGLVDLALVGRAIAEIGEADVLVVPVLVGEGEPGTQRHVGADDAVPAIELLLLREHVHRAALALGVAALAAGQLGHHALGVHAAGEHVPVVAVSRDALIALDRRRLQPDDHGLLADIEVAEATDQPHAVELPSPLLEAADQQHVAVESQELVGGRQVLAGAPCCRTRPRGAFRPRHWRPPGCQLTRD